MVCGEEMTGRAEALASFQVLEVALLHSSLMFWRVLSGALSALEEGTRVEAVMTLVGGQMWLAEFWVYRGHSRDKFVLLGKSWGVPVRRIQKEFGVSCECGAEA